MEDTKRMIWNMWRLGKLVVWTHRWSLTWFPTKATSTTSIKITTTTTTTTTKTTTTKTTTQPTTTTTTKTTKTTILTFFQLKLPKKK